jgi:superfamily II DNA or RNA helicase
LRDYQEASLQLWQAAGGRGVVVLPTGGGKTHVAIGAIVRAQVPTLCLVPPRVLLHQWRSALGAPCGCSIGTLGDGLRTVEAITVVATFESAFRAMERIGHRFGLLVVNEAHHFGNGIRDEALEMCAAPARLGLTATPSAGATAERLNVLIGPVVYRLGVSDLAGGFLSSYDIVPVEVELEPAERAAYEAALTLFRSAHRPFAAATPRATWADFVRAASQSDGGRRALAAWRRRRSRGHIGRPARGQ